MRRHLLGFLSVWHHTTHTASLLHIYRIFPWPVWAYPSTSRVVPAHEKMLGVVSCILIFKQSFYLPTSLQASFSIRHLTRHQLLYCILPTFSAFSRHLFRYVIYPDISFYTVFHLLFLSNPGILLGTSFIQTSVSILFSTYFFYLFQASFSERHLSRHQFLYCFLPTFSIYSRHLFR
jgi:hypothetical protein